MQTKAIVLSEPKRIEMRELGLKPVGFGDAIVEIDWSGISTGTERLLYDGTMPPFPGMGYPLVPGYEAVGRVIEADAEGVLKKDQTVFVPGATCFEGARGLFGASASHLVVPAKRVMPVKSFLGEQATLLALAATAYHTFSAPDALRPELIVGHGVLGRLLARIVIAMGDPAPVVWETDSRRTAGADDYEVIHPDDDPRRDYNAVTDVSGDPAILDTLIGRLAPCGEIVLGGFYKEPLSFAFPPAFMREARLRVAAQWQPGDLRMVCRLAETGAVSLGDLITHRASADNAPEAYATAFSSADCLKMVLDWRHG